MKLAVFAALTLALGATPALAFSDKFDGEWAVEVRTTVGECEPVVSGAVTIAGGQIIASSGADIGAWGYLEDSGDLSARFTRGQDMLRAQGKLKGKAGAGAWSSNTRYCGGKWSARKAG